MPTQFEKHLPRSPDAPYLARTAVTKWLGDAFDAEELARAKLLVSELITNAVVYGEGEIALRVHLDADRVLVEVIDEGGGFEHQIRQQGFDNIGGRGLAIVDAESARWGIHEGTTHVLFELEREGPRLGPPSDA